LKLWSRNLLAMCMSRAPCGARELKPTLSVRTSYAAGRAPCGARELKLG